jgi:hypothetical protein
VKEEEEEEKEEKELAEGWEGQVSYHIQTHVTAQRIYDR